MATNHKGIASVFELEGYVIDFPEMFGSDKGVCNQTVLLTYVYHATLSPFKYSDTRELECEFDQGCL